MATTIARRLFATSWRSLALFRFALGTVVALEVADKWPLLEALYTDTGALPRSAVLPLPEDGGEGLLAWVVSVHSWHGSLLWVQTLSCLQLVFAAALASGAAPVTSSLGCWWLHCSCALRNASLVYILDRYLHLLLLFSALLPVAPRASLASPLAPSVPTRTRRHTRVSAAAVGALAVQLWVIYLDAGVGKVSDCF